MDNKQLLTQAQALYKQIAVPPQFTEHQRVQMLTACAHAIMKNSPADVPAAAEVYRQLLIRFPAMEVPAIPGFLPEFP